LVIISKTRQIQGTMIGNNLSLMTTKSSKHMCQVISKSVHTRESYSQDEIN